MPVYRYSVIKSIQFGSIALGTSASVTATITSVVLANSYVQMVGNSQSQHAGSSNSDIFNVAMTNATTVTVARNGTADQSPETVKFMVTEYGSGFVKSMQDFSVTMNAVTTNTATVTSVSTTKTQVIHRGFNWDTTAPDITSSQATLVQTNATTITSVRRNAGGTLIVYGTLPEFK